MAKITYGDELPDDSVGKKFQGAVYDTGSANAIAAVKGVNPVTQQGKTVVDQSVAVSTASGAGAAIGATGDAAITTDTTGTQSGKLRGIVAWFARLGSLDGAAFTAGSSYVWPGLAGVYQSTVDVLTAGQRGLLRATSRRALVTAGDFSTLTLTSGTPVPSGSDITNNNGSAIVAGDLAIRDTAIRYFAVPMGSYKSVSFGIKNVAAWDQTPAFTVLVSPGVASSAMSLLASFTGNLAINSVFTISPSSSSSVGGRTGDATMTLGSSHYGIPALADAWSYVLIGVSFASAPTTGELSITIERRA